MATRLPWETRAGSFDKPATQMQLIEHLRLAAEAAYGIGHYLKANDDKLIGQGYLGIGQLLEKTADQVAKLATKGITVQ